MARAMLAGFSEIDCWIFDLDNTLYPARANLFELIDQRMGLFVQELLGLEPAEARRVQKGFFHSHGTTLAGLMDVHDVDPHLFLDFAHDIPMDRISSDPALERALAALPGRKLIYTNGDAAYAARVLEALGIADSFDGMHDILASNLIPKPDPASYRMLIEAHGIDPGRALFVEDMVRNLAPAKALGMTTVWVDNGSEQAGHEGSPNYVDHRIEDVSAWLTQLTGELVS
jgi:putative hydrolase of the HAD superfamily